MKKYLDNLPKEILQLVYLARDVAAEKGLHAYLVGGFVRDLILGVPNFDLDIVVQDNAFMFASEIARRLKVRLITHHRFGTGTLITPGKIKVDIATIRRESYPHPGSLPDVSPGTIEEDLARRDFTINALAIDLIPRNFGKVVDYYHGRNDLQAGIIRILHDLSFIDDPTRIIRAVRFERRFEFRIEPRSLKLLQDAKRMGMLKRLSPHRLRDELILILKEPRAYNCILRLDKLAGFDFMHPNLKLNKKNLHFLALIKKEINWFRGSFSKRRNLDGWLMYCIGILSPLKREEINQVCKRFGLRRGEVKRVLTYKKFPKTKIQRLSKKNISPSQLYQILESLSFEVILLIKAEQENKNLKHNIERFLRCYNGIRLHVSGEDLNKLGLKPSPDYKKILNRLLSHQLNGKIKSRRDALNWIVRFFLPKLKAGLN
ncbi:MAG: CCA tRNA nucleotidyltransferase [Candidatus Omnitrophota bacterium]